MIWNVFLISREGYILVDRPYKAAHHPFELHLIEKSLFAFFHFEKEAFQIYMDKLNFLTFQILLLQTSEFGLACITDLDDDTVTVNVVLSKIAEELRYLYPDTFSTTKSLPLPLWRRTKLIIDYFMFTHQLVSLAPRKSSPRANREQCNI